MYGEDYVRRGNSGMPYGYSRKSTEVWEALADFANKFMEHYDPEATEHAHRSYGRYGDEFGRYEDRMPENSYARYRGQPRTASGRFKRVRYSHGRENDPLMRDGSQIGMMLASGHDQDWLIEKAIGEASEFIHAATKRDEYEMFKEFCELCILMKGVGEYVPEELESQACEKALEYYARKAEGMDYHNPLLDEYHRRSRMYN